MKKLALMLCALCTMFLLAGCGGNTDASSGGGESASGGEGPSVYAKYSGVADKKEDAAYSFTDAALAFISDKGFDPQFGARPVKRVIQKYVLNELSKELLGGTVNKDRPIIIDSDGSGLVFKN